jgi:hypothetical protein
LSTRPTRGPLSATRSIVRSGNRSVSALARNLLDPLLVVVALMGYGMVHARRDPEQGPGAGLVAFSLSYPGSVPYATRPAMLFRQIFGNWAVLWRA